MNIIESGNVPSLDDIKYKKNDEGKYSFIIKGFSANYTTDFLYDSFEVLTRHLLKVSRVDETGVIKYGLLSDRGSSFFLPCIFDKFKAYDSTYIRGYLNGEVYYIDSDGRVFSKEMVDLRAKYE